MIWVTVNAPEELSLQQQQVHKERSAEETVSAGVLVSEASPCPNVAG